jgi:ketosteroid isomerase-like protein
MKDKLTTTICIALTVSAFSLLNTSQIQAQISTSDNIQDIIPRSPAARIARQFLQNLEQKNANAIARLWDEEAIYELPYALPNTPSQFKGKEAAQQNILRIIKMFEQIEVEKVRFYPTEDPNIILVETNGNFIVADRDKTYRNKYIAVIEIKNNRIVLLREYFNPLIVAKTFNLNLAPKSP